ncbi:MAG: phytanoyl-CoA dioxygenase family protein [Kiritimatiellae bacterium]|nr:phytanoyl-CoA dioxygenase family protein [Kiritimatiellia bacterium]
MNAALTTQAEPFTDSTDLLEAPEALRERAAEDGYLFFKKFLPTEPVLELRRQMLDVLASHGWMREDAEDIADLAAINRLGVDNETLSAMGVTNAVYRDIQCLELFHQIPHDPKLISLYETLFEAEVLPHPRHIARVMVPTPKSAPTPPHQDYIYIQGTHQFWTLWFPLGDCPLELGGLSVLGGSHREEVLDVMPARGAGGKEAILCDMDYRWVQGDYACGDILTFPSHMVHCGLPNQRGQKVRLSCDIRYQAADAEIEERSLAVHMGVAEWDDVYAEWKSDDLKYYWRKRELAMSDWDNSLMEDKERLC